MFASSCVAVKMPAQIIVSGNRHFEQLQEHMKRTKPNKKVLFQLLTLDFESRRDWIDVQLKDNIVKAVLDKYPCFRNADEVMLCIMISFTLGESNTK